MKKFGLMVGALMTSVTSFAQMNAGNGGYVTINPPGCSSGQVTLHSNADLKKVFIKDDKIFIKKEILNTLSPEDEFKAKLRDYCTLVRLSNNERLSEEARIELAKEARELLQSLISPKKSEE